MVKRLLKTFMAVLAIAAAAAGPVRGQNSNVSWVLTPYGDLQNGDTVVIVDKTYERAMSNNNGSFSAPSAVEIGLSGDQNALSDAPAATLQWVVERDNGNYMFKVPGTSNYLYCTSDNDGVRVGSGNKSFEFQDGGTYNVPFLKNNATSRYLGLTNAYLWRCPSSISGSSIKDNVISFYKKTVIIIPPITVRMAKGTEEAANWTLASGNASVPGTQALENVMSGSTLTATYAGDLKIKEVIATKHVPPVPLTIEALTAGTIVVQNPEEGMQYTLNGGTKTAVTSDAINVAVGDKVAFYGNGTRITSYSGTNIAGGTADVKVYGNIMSLVNENGFDTATTLTTVSQFYQLFRYYEHLKDASGLLLPATTLTPMCYAYMFRNCYSLTAAPALPATTLAQDCYNNMFNGCTSLTTAPALPATTLAEYCYSRMFYNCTSLTTAPVLPATTLVACCYNGMFTYCSNLNSVTCLATSGINQNSSTTTWLKGAGTEVEGTKTFTAVSTTEWPTDDVSGIPEGWTRQNIDN